MKVIGAANIVQYIRRFENTKFNNNATSGEA